MRLFLSKHTYFVLLVLIFIISEIIVNPIGDFPLNDDWSYGKSVLFTLQGNYTIGEFGAMTLFTHLMWGTLFAKVFGFSFTVLRMSTLISVVISMFFMNKLIIKISDNKTLGFLACLILLFNPLYFNLANTFMTDVNFNTLLIMCCYYAFQFFETKKVIYLIVFFALAAFLILIRQFGIIVPICFLFACLAIRENRSKYLVFSLIGSISVFTVFKLYENYLSAILPEGSVYKFSNSVPVFTLSFWIAFFENLADKYRVILLHILIYTSPMAIIFLRSIVQESKRKNVLWVSVFWLCISLLLFTVEKFPHHNVFTNMALGPDNFYEASEHNFSGNFAIICDVVKILFSAITLITLTLYGLSIKKRKIRFSTKPKVLFLFGLLATYIFMILIITESYFDRYHIPLITLTIILFAYVNKIYKVNYYFAIVPLLCFSYVSVLGTKDYLTLNRNKWEAYDYIKKKANTTAGKINGGFEVNCWDDGKNSWWRNYTDLTNFDFLIQFKKEDGFVLLKEYEFQRYFPYKKDKLSIFIRDGKAAEYQIKP